MIICNGMMQILWMITLKDPHILDDPFSAVYLSELPFQSHYKDYQDTYFHIAGRIIINQRLSE
jgi:hypothetical protein